MSEPVRIPLRARDGAVRGYALVDAVDAEWVNQHRWHMTRKGYAQRCVWVNGQVRGFSLHREVLGLTREDPVDVDHINRDRLDCRRENLRALPKGANAQNTGGWRNASSQYRGVSWDRASGKWVAKIRVGSRAEGKHRTLGRFNSELEAAEVARAARARLMPYSVEPTVTAAASPAARRGVSARTKKRA